MIYDISKFEELIKEGFLRKSEKEDLVLYGYTDKTTFARNWNVYTRVARGLILNKHTGEVVAKPFPKFFNLGELEETFLINLPEEPYSVYEKLDGSLGILFCYKDVWQISTRGSFYSEQALKAQEILKKYKTKSLNKSTTYLVEIIYPDNKIVVNYGTEEKLVLLSSYDNSTAEERAWIVTAAHSSLSGIELAKKYNYTIQEIIELQKTLPKDQEGFVVRFQSGLRVKIKGNEYMKIAKMISNMSPISFWEGMENGVVNKTYLAQLPEEFRSEYEPIVEELEKQYKDTKKEITDFCLGLGLMLLGDNWRKEVGLFLKTSNFVYLAGVFPYLLKSEPGLNNYIMKQIRPNENILNERN